MLKIIDRTLTTFDENLPSGEKLLEFCIMLIKTGINVIIADDSISCVALGTGKALDNIEAIEASALSEGRGNYKGNYRR